MASSGGTRSAVQGKALVGSRRQAWLAQALLAIALLCATMNGRADGAGSDVVYASDGARSVPATARLHEWLQEEEEDALREPTRREQREEADPLRDPTRRERRDPTRADQADDDPLRDPTRRERREGDPLDLDEDGDGRTFEQHSFLDEQALIYSDPEPWLLTFMDAPLGYTGPSGVLPTEPQQSSHFVPVEDRWREGFPEWDRDGQGDPIGEDAPYDLGHWWDPYNQNVIKGDYPIIGQHTFMNFTATSASILEYRQVPTPTTPFESTLRRGQEEFFGNPNQFFYNQNIKLSLSLLHGDAAFKPTDWQIRISPVFNVNYLDVEELGIVNPDVRQGTTRRRGYVSFDEWFAETKLADLSTDYDFVSARAGSQFFTSDFRGFIFSDTNRGVRLFGTRLSNREQFNVVWFDQTEKDTNSLLNTFDDRHQNTTIVNYFRQDFIWPGYTAEASFHYNRDGPDFLFDRNEFLVRPDPAGVFAPHEVQAYYFGFAGDGHINRVNISNAFYYVTGRDDLNPIAGKDVDLDAYMAAIELSYDRDWARFRSSFFWASGDDDPNDDIGQGFDAITDNPNFAGGEFSYWQRQAIGLFGVNLVNRMSLVPDLRSNKFQGQSNFVNPGLYLYNIGFDADITPKLKWINNVNFLWFERTAVLETFIFQGDVNSRIGTDLSTGVEYRPLLNNNIIFVGGISGLIPDDGFRDLFTPLRGDAQAMAAGFMDFVLTY